MFSFKMAKEVDLAVMNVDRGQANWTADDHFVIRVDIVRISPTRGRGPPGRLGAKSLNNFLVFVRDDVRHRLDDKQNIVWLLCESRGRVASGGGKVASYW